MKRIIYKTRSIFLSAMLLLISCDNFEEMNRNPTTSTDMDANLMLPTVQLSLSGGQYEQWRNGFIYADEWMQHWAGEYASTEYGGKGQKRNDYMSALWDTQFPNEVKNIVDMVERTTNVDAKKNINSVSRIMKVYIFSRLTDLYGDIPYFDAGKGYYTKVFTPAYDKQEDIYADFFKELDVAVKGFDASKETVTQDFYFNGDLNKWKKFGNSLRLRLAMRLTKVNPEKAKIEAEAAIAGGVMQSNADMAMMQHNSLPFDGGKLSGGNGVSHVFMNASPIESAYRLCTTFIDYMVSTSDPRITMYGSSYLKDNDRTEITEQVFDQVGNYHDMGLPPSTFSYEVTGGSISIDVNGTPTSVTPILQRLQPSKFISANSAPYIMMSYAEVELWMAEAAFRTWATGSTAEDHFKRALEAGVKQMTVYGIAEAPPAAISSFVATNPLVPGEELEQINSQLWVNFALNGQEAFSNWRRSGFPAIVYPNRDPGVNQSNGEIPRRMQYAVNEYLLNDVNVKAAAARMADGDLWTNRVWWDK